MVDFNLSQVELVQHFPNNDTLKQKYNSMLPMALCLSNYFQVLISIKHICFYFIGIVEKRREK